MLGGISGDSAVRYLQYIDRNPSERISPKGSCLLSQSTHSYRISRQLEREVIEMPVGA